MRRVVKAFAELRTMADDGQIHYPYSTREVVNIIRHLEVNHKYNIREAKNDYYFVF